MPNYNDNTWPVVHNNIVYHMSSEAASKKFINQPSRYIKARIRLSPPDNILPACVVFGDELSGRSTLCKNLENRLSAVRITTSKALRLVENYPTELAATVIVLHN